MATPTYIRAPHHNLGCRRPLYTSSPDVSASRGRKVNDRLRSTTSGYNYNYITLHYAPLHYTTLHYTNYATLTTLHYNYNYNNIPSEKCTSTSYIYIYHIYISTCLWSSSGANHRNSNCLRWVSVHDVRSRTVQRNLTVARHLATNSCKANHD